MVVLGCGPAVHGGALGVVHVCVIKNSLGVPLYHVRRFVVVVLVNIGGEEAEGVGVMKAVDMAGTGVTPLLQVVVLVAVVDSRIREALEV